MAPAPREGPACLGSCCHQPSHSPATLGPDAPGGARSQRLPVRGEQQPPAAPAPSWGQCHVRLCGLCSAPVAQLGGSASPPWGSRGQEYYLNFPTSSPPVTGSQPLHCPASGQSEEEPLSPCPRGRHGDSDPCTLTGEESPRHWRPSFPPSLDAGAQPGGWRRQQVLLLSPQPRFSSSPRRPGSGTTERQIRVVPHWSSLALRSLCPQAGPGPVHQDHRGQPGWPGSTVRGASWASQCVPWAVQPPAPARQCHYPQGATSPAACPLAPVALPFVVSSLLPQGLGWLPPPVCSLPGAFLCRFLYVILKWKNETMRFYKKMVPDSSAVSDSFVPSGHP